MKSFLPLLFLFACTSHPKTAPHPVYTVKVGNVIKRDVPLFFEALGHVESIDSIEIKSRIEGELMQVLFTEGQEVKRGDLLFTIDTRPYEIKLREAEATLEESLAQLFIAQEKVKRYAPLARDEYLSQINYEELQTQLASQTAVVERNRAAVDNAKLNLNYCWITAPIDGRTGILQVDLGNLVSADGSTPLITLNQMAPIYVTFSLPEVHLPKILTAPASLPVHVAFESFEEGFIEGALQMIDNAVDRRTGMVKLRGIFENLDRHLWPGQFVRTRLILKTVQALTIPYTAVQVTPSGPLVFVVKENKTVEARAVQLGQREDEEIIVTKGLSEGERIVTEGQINLIDGSEVKW